MRFQSPNNSYEFPIFYKGFYITKDLMIKFLTITFKNHVIEIIMNEG